MTYIPDDEDEITALIAVDIICPYCSLLIIEMYEDSGWVQCPCCGEMVNVVEALEAEEWDA